MSNQSSPHGLKLTGTAVSLLREVMEHQGKIISDPRNKLNEILIKEGVEYSVEGKIDKSMHHTVQVNGVFWYPRC